MIISQASWSAGSANTGTEWNLIESGSLKPVYRCTLCWKSAVSISEASLLLTTVPSVRVWQASKISLERFEFIEVVVSIRGKVWQSINYNSWADPHSS